MFASRKIALWAAAGLAPLVMPIPLQAYPQSSQFLTGVLSIVSLQTADEPEPARRPDEVRREYDLKPDKAAAFFELLSPADVKVMVGQREGGVFIKGTPQEGKVFDAFFEILTRHAHQEIADTDAFIEKLRPTWDSEETYQLPPPKAAALYTLLALDDVPVMVSRHQDGLNIEASKADQQTIADVVRVLKGERLDGRPRAERPRPDRPRRAQRPSQPAPPDAGQQGRLEEMVERLETRRKELEQRAEELTERAKQIAQAVDELSAQIEQEARRFAEEIQQRVAPPPPPAPDAPDAPPPGGESIVREYRLPPVHAQNLFNLLAPSDIRDVVVSRHDDVLEIRASPHDHDTIARLVDILTRGPDSSAAR